MPRHHERLSGFVIRQTATQRNSRLKTDKFDQRERSSTAAQALSVILAVSWRRPHTTHNKAVFAVPRLSRRSTVRSSTQFLLCPRFSLGEKKVTSLHKCFVFDASFVLKK